MKIKFPHLNVHHVYACLLVGIGAAQSHLTDVQQYITPKHFGLLTMAMGVSVAILGFAKSD